ncbi:MAG: PilN domain-containing protein [Planctomycetes bacterium]|nr:PilN domain-containing protein [Planctomycetota bacterium]
MRELEFLPEEYLRARFQRRIGFVRSWLLLAIGLAMVLYSFQMGTWVRDAQAELVALRGSGAAVAPDVAKVRMLRAEARVYNERLERLDALRPALAVTNILADVVQAVPDAVVLECLDVSTSPAECGESLTVRVQGLARSEEGVTAMVAGLDALPRFTQTILVESRLVDETPDGRRAFAIEAEVVPEAAPTAPSAKE